MPEIGNSSVWKQTDADNTTGTQPSWSGSASPDTIDNAGRAMMGAITREWNWRNYTLTAGGSSSAYTLTYTVAPDALYDGQRFAFVTNHANTGATTLNVNALGATDVKKVVAGTVSALDADDWAAGQFVEVAYSSANSAFIWTNRSGANILGTANTFTADQTIKSTDAGASAGPSLILHRDSASPAASDDIGAIKFDGEDAAGNQTTYAQINAAIQDTTNGSEDGALEFQAMSAGSLSLMMKFWGYGYGYIVNATASYPEWEFANTHSGATSGKIVFSKRRTSSIVQSSDAIGKIQFKGYDGSTDREAATIEAIVDGTPGASDMPGALVFSTTADGATTATERFRLAANGFATISNGSFGRGAPVTKTADFTVGDTENWIIVNKSGACTVTLPAASSWTGREITIKNITTSSVSSASSNVVPKSTDTAGTAILPISNDGGFATLVSDGTNWIIMATNV